MEMTQASLQIEVYVIEWTRAEDAKEDWHTHATIETYRRLGKGKIEAKCDRISAHLPQRDVVHTSPSRHARKFAKG